MSKTVGYARVSTKDQNLDRQIDDFHRLGIEDKNIYSDKMSGKNFDRVEYYYMKKSLEKRRYFSNKRPKKVRKKQARNERGMGVLYEKWYKCKSYRYAYFKY